MTMTSDVCASCGGTGRRTLYRQGDPIYPGVPMVVWACTIWVVCECRYTWALVREYPQPEPQVP
jgi:hypothetical protein